MIVAHNATEQSVLLASVLGLLRRNRNGSALLINKAKGRVEVVPEHLTRQMLAGDEPLLTVPEGTTVKSRKVPYVPTDAGLRRLRAEIG